MKTAFSALVAILLMTSCVYVKKDTNVLIVTGGHDFEKEEFFEMFDDMDGLTYTHMEQPDVQKFYNTENAAPYDVIVFYDMWETITEEAAKGLSDMVGNGKPLLVLHHAICGYNDWPEFINIAGGKYVKKPFTDPATGEPTLETVFKHNRTVEVREVEGNGVVKLAAPFTYVEERYYDMYIKPDVKPLLMCREEGRPEEIVAWENKYGEGTVISLLLGHDKTVYGNPDFRSVLGQCIDYLAIQNKQKQRQ